MTDRLYTALTIGGFDGSAGAGIQADLKTFSALGCYGLTVLTALPIQNTQSVKSIYNISESCVAEQLEAIIEDIEIDVIKIGMLHRASIVEVVANILEKLLPLQIVVDPVMAAKNGHELLEKKALEVMRKRLFPITTLLTPNLLEASILIQSDITSKKEMEDAALKIISQGPQSVLVKGGHLEQDLCEDFLSIEGKKIQWYVSPKVRTNNTHGTGCTLSAAIAAFLAKGLPLVDAVACGKDYISQCIVAAQTLKIGKGQGPLHHFFPLGEICSQIVHKGIVPL